MEPACAAALASDVGISGAAEAADCCTADPLAECHHRDLLSMRDSPPYEEDREPFWPEPLVGTVTA
jgi:4'-phosphopantetheinyl transferase EntD